MSAMDDLKKFLDENPGVEVELPGRFTEEQLRELGFEEEEPKQ